MLGNAEHSSKIIVLFIKKTYHRISPEIFFLKNMLQIPGYVNANFVFCHVDTPYTDRTSVAIDFPNFPTVVFVARAALKKTEKEEER